MAAIATSTAILGAVSTSVALIKEAKNLWERISSWGQLKMLAALVQTVRQLQENFAKIEELTRHTNDQKTVQILTKLQATFVEVVNATNAVVENEFIDRNNNSSLAISNRNTVAQLLRKCEKIRVGLEIVQERLSDDLTPKMVAPIADPKLIGTKIDEVTVTDPLKQIFKEFTDFVEEELLHS